MAATPTVLVRSDDLTAPCVCFIGMVEHPFDVQAVARNVAYNIVSVPFENWDDTLTPWPAPALYATDDDFKGLAAHTLTILQDETLPAVAAQHGLTPRAWGIAGYSLGGLFSLYAFTQSTFFQTAASMSGSLWYENWTERLETLSIPGKGRFAYLSIGTGEKRAKQKILKGVESRTERTAQILKAAGCEVEYRTSPGTHFMQVDERLRAGLDALDAFWKR
jgi:predicted alpha/beta superfamily hydrolase